MNYFVPDICDEMNGDIHSKICALVKSHPVFRKYCFSGEIRQHFYIVNYHGENFIGWTDTNKEDNRGFFRDCQDITLEELFPILEGVNPIEYKTPLFISSRIILKLESL